MTGLAHNASRGLNVTFPREEPTLYFHTQLIIQQKGLGKITHLGNVHTLLPSFNTDQFLTKRQERERVLTISSVLKMKVSTIPIIF